MRLLRLQLSQYRTYASLDLDLGASDLHLFIGENGSGKTNLLEAISVLSLLHSFLGVEDECLRQWGTDFYRIQGEVQSDASLRERLEVVSQVQPRHQRAYFRNDVRLTSQNMIGKLPVVAFLPFDLDLFTGSPAERRSFLDRILMQTSPAYEKALREYQRSLKQRNTLLRTIASLRAKESELDPWDDRVAEEGGVLTLARLELTETFGLSLASQLQELGEKDWKDVRLQYDRTGKARDAASLAEEHRELLRHFRSRDVLVQATTVGPHRDDWHVEAEGRPLAAFASRGQRRVCLLSLLFMEASYLEIRRGEKPVILLDDVFSELDDAHQERIRGTLAGHQMFVTATHLPKTLRGAQVWDVREGITSPR